MAKTRKVKSLWIGGALAIWGLLFGLIYYRACIQNKNLPVVIPSTNQNTFKKPDPKILSKTKIYLPGRHNVYSLADKKTYAMRTSEDDGEDINNRLLIEVQNDAAEWVGDGKYQMLNDDGSKFSFQLKNSKLEGRLKITNPNKKTFTYLHFREGVFVSGYMTGFDRKFLCSADYSKGKLMKSTFYDKYGKENSLPGSRNDPFKGILNIFR